jgi:ammonia channel protein AmtB
LIDAGNAAWLTTATALVLFTTLPGLALFHRELVRAENLLPVLMPCFAGIAATLLSSLVVSFIIAQVVQAVAGWRVSAETEQQGLDVSLHGERAYNM